MLKPVIVTALNAQIQHELESAYAYQALAFYFGHLNLHGFEAFMERQAKEERMHADKFINHLSARGGQADLGAIPEHQTNFGSIVEAACAVREMERATTDKIHHLFNLARHEKDYALEVLLHWYIAQQVEEEQWSGELSALTEQFNERPGQMFILDHQWGERVEAK